MIGLEQSKVSKNKISINMCVGTVATLILMFCLIMTIFLPMS